MMPTHEIEAWGDQRKEQHDEERTQVPSPDGPDPEGAERGEHEERNDVKCFVEALSNEAFLGCTRDEKPSQTLLRSGGHIPFQCLPKSA